MRISTRIRASAVLIIVVAVAASAALASGFIQTGAAIERNDRVAQSLDGIFQLSMLTTDFLIHYEDRAQRQWLEKHESLGNSLGELEVETPADGMLLARVTENHTEVARLFAAIVAAHAEGEVGTVDPEVSREYQTRLAARLLIEMQSMVSDSVTLGSNSSREALTIQRRTLTLVLGVSLVGIALMIVNAIGSNRAILRPLVTLRDSAVRVGKGELEHRSGIATRDELGELAVAFDAMVGDLQRSYALLEREIAERRRAESELSEYRDHLERIVEERTGELIGLNEDLTRATRAKDDFLAAMSHELRTPLNSIIGFTDIMLKGLAGELADEQRRQLAMVYQSGKQLLALINDVLDLSRIEAGHVDVVAAPFPLAPTVGALVEMMAPLAHERGVEIGWRIEEGVSATIETDRGKLEQIMLNLLSNAVRFTDHGRVEVVVRAERDDGVALEVRDTGIGIAEEEFDAIFEQFHQVRHEGITRGGGTGLGLAISRRLARALGGDLTVASEVGIGSTFTLRLPRSISAR